MACTLTGDIDLGCRDSVGGIKRLYVTALENITAITSTTGVISAITMTTGTEFFTYNLEKESAEWTETTTISQENWTKVSEQSLTAFISKMTAAKRNELKLLSQNRIAATVLDRNGLYWLLGENNGLDLVTKEAKTGKAMGDGNGFTLTFSGKEESEAQTVSSSIIATITAPAA